MKSFVLRWKIYPLRKEVKSTFKVLSARRLYEYRKKKEGIGFLIYILKRMALFFLFLENNIFLMHLFL